MSGIVPLAFNIPYFLRFVYIKIRFAGILSIDYRKTGRSDDKIVAPMHFIPCCIQYLPRVSGFQFHDAFPIYPVISLTFIELADVMAASILDKSVNIRNVFSPTSCTSSVVPVTKLKTTQANTPMIIIMDNNSARTVQHGFSGNNPLFSPQSTLLYDRHHLSSQDEPIQVQDMPIHSNTPGYPHKFPSHG
jgi:hypothetical protein